MLDFSRRTFLENAGRTMVGAALAPAIATTSLANNFLDVDSKRPLNKTYRCAAIGSTGNGGFGHGLDRVFIDLPGVEFVAIADDNPTGLKKAGERNGINRLYTDYRTMLKKEKLDAVSVGMRQSENHEKIVIDCANAGKHIYCEKPLAPDLASVDGMLQACDRNGVKLAVALTNRASLAIRRAFEMVREGRLGKLLAMRGRGKEDRRGGGEDLMVLGYHILDMMHLFGGDPQWTFAQVTQNGRDIVKSDGHAASEPIGRVAGDALTAIYGFPNGVHGYFVSHRGLKKSGDRFSLEIYGSEGIITTRSLRDVMWFEGPIFNPSKSHHWQPITTIEWDEINKKSDWCSQQLVLDLLRSVEEDREPVSSGSNSRWVMEMILSVYTSQLAKARVALPLKEREHPLG